MGADGASRRPRALVWFFLRDVLHERRDSDWPRKAPIKEAIFEDDKLQLTDCKIKNVNSQPFKVTSFNGEGPVRAPRERDPKERNVGGGRTLPIWEV